MSESITETENVAGYSNLRLVKRYSWGSNMDHSESWIECKLCKNTLAHSDYGCETEEEMDEMMAHHQSGECIEYLQKLRASARMNQFAVFAPEVPF